mgnify:CR=1 FL=1
MRRGTSRIGHLHQSGSYKLLFPRGFSNGPDQALQVVSLNTAGGVTGGDRFHLAVRAEAGSRMVMTTQAAERVYRAQPGEIGQVRTVINVETGAALDWLPQETIQFNFAALDRRLEAHVTPDGRLLAVEPIIFGRKAMGEVVAQGFLIDRWRVTRGDELVFADNLCLDGPVHDLLQRPGVANGEGAMASLLLVAGDADLYLDRVRQVLGPDGGASLIRPGVLFARVFGADGFDLRRGLIPAIKALSGAEIPKTWML